MRVNIPTECLMNNILDEDFQAMLFPLSIFQKVFMISNYTILSNFITPNNKFDNVKTFIGAVIFTLISCFQFSFLLNHQTSNTFTFPLWFDFVYHSSFALMIYIVSALQSGNTVLLIIKLQHALHAINMDNKKMLFNAKFWNWVHIIVILAYYALYLITAVLFDGVFPSQVVVMFFYIIFDLNVIYATRTFMLVSSVLAMWNEKMFFFGKANPNQEQIENDDFKEVLLKAYIDIIEAFRLSEKIYQLTVAYQTVKIFLLILSTTQGFLEAAKMAPPSLLSNSYPHAKLFSAFWHSKNIILLTFVCIASEKVYKNVKIAETLCAKLLKTGDSDLQKLCKNVLRFNDAAFRKISVLGAFEVDAALVPKLLVTLVAYVVVLLQFALL